MSLISSLYRLQQIDSQLDQAHLRLKQIDEILSNQSELDAAEAHFQQVDSHLNQLKKLLHKCETQANDQKIKIQQNESSLYGGRIHNPKELQDLQNEVVSLKRYLAVLEDRQLDAMLNVEEAAAQLDQAKAALEQTRGRMIEQNSGLLAEQTHLNQMLTKLNVERQAAEDAVPAESLEQYNRLRKTRHGLAIAEVKNHSCGACGSTLSQALIQSTSQGSVLINCPMCGRMLYT